MTEPISTPEIEKPVAAVGDTAQSTPTETPAPPVSIIGASPLSPEAVRQLQSRVGRISMLNWFMLLGLILCMAWAGFDLYTTPTEYLKALESLTAMALLGALWTVVIVRRRSRNAQMPSPWNTVRRNELYEQGAVSRSAFGTSVVPFDEVTLYAEYADMLILRSPHGTVVWSAADLTPAAAASLQAYLRAHVPTGTYRNGGTLFPSAAALSPIPSVPPAGTCHATATAETDSFAVALLRLSRVLEQSAPLLLLFSMAIGNLVPGAVLFSFEPFNNRFVWFAVTALLLAAGMFALLWAEAARQIKAKTSPSFRFCEDGLWMSVGRGEVRFPPGTVRAIPRRKALQIALPVGDVRLPYAGMSDQTLIYRYFGLQG